MRPKIMQIFDNLRDQNVLVLEHAKKANKKIVGMYCAFSPQELVLAAGALPVSLCGTRQEPVDAAEKVLPRNLCPLIKSSFGFAITDTCPYFRLSDFIIAETTCDGKKKMFELLSKYKPIHVMHLPQGANRKEAVEWWVKELTLLKEYLEGNLKVSITQESLRLAIKIMNKERVSLKNLHGVNKLKPAPLTGLDMLKAIWMKGFNVEKEEGTELVNELIEEILKIYKKGFSPFQENTPRILLTGCPVGIGSEKVVRLLEECGGSVVCFENCSGYKTLDKLVDEDENKDSLEAIAEKYLKIPCSCLSPNKGRLDLIGRLIKEYQIDGVVDLTWQACHTYNIEATLIRKLVEDDFGLPYLHLETDYSTSDIEVLKTRTAAFIEILSK